jgi:phosphate-selective porin
MKHCCNSKYGFLTFERLTKIKTHNSMKKIITVFLFIIETILGYSQINIDSLNEKIENHEGRINSLDERVLVNESDLGKLNKIKVSGYIQAQFESYQEDLVKTNDPNNTLYIRRARVKFTYEATDGVKFVLQPDFSTGNLSLKDAYAVVNIPKLKSLSLWAGQFNRLNYEVEYSSSQREVLERSRVIRTIYPGEREIGLKLEYTPSQVPLKLQLAMLNGNFTGKEAKDIDSRKDFMARATYSFRLTGAGMGIDIGAHGYWGSLMAKTKYVLDYEDRMDTVSFTPGSYLDKRWIGAEIQFFYDLLGGMSLKGEYIAGKNAFIGDSQANPYKIKRFSGYYAYLIKNVGKKNQFVARYDYLDPNTKLSGDDAGKDIAYSTLAIAWQFYLNDNIRLTLQYDMPWNETNSTTPDDLKDNVLGIRVQAKF